MGDGTDVSPAPVLDKPFTATVESMSPYQSPSGESLRHITLGLKARDRFGRTRNETENGAWTVGEQIVPTKDVQVYDPVSHCQFNWIQPVAADATLPGKALAFVTCGPQTLRYQELNITATVLGNLKDGITTSGDTTTKIEHLPPFQIDGIKVDGVRVTNSHRSETGKVNQWSTETWYSPDLEETIRLGDEETGYKALINIRRIDPDPKLFYPPDGYDIQLRPQ